MISDLDLMNSYAVATALKSHTLETTGIEVLAENSVEEIINTQFIPSYGILGSTRKRVVDASSLLKYEGEQFILMCYLRILERIPEKSEISFYATPLNSGTLSKLDVEKRIAKTEEAKEKNVLVILPEYELEMFLRYYDRDFITVLYILLLNRMPDPDGFHKYLEDLRKGIKGRIEIINAIAESCEAREVCPNLQIYGLEKALKN